MKLIRNCFAPRFIDAVQVRENCFSASLIGGRIVAETPVAVQWRFSALSSGTESVTQNHIFHPFRFAQALAPQPAIPSPAAARSSPAPLSFRYAIAKPSGPAPCPLCAFASAHKRKRVPGIVESTFAQGSGAFERRYAELELVSGP